MRVANLKLTKQLFNETLVKIGRFVYGIPILGYCSRVAVTVAKLPLIGERLIEVERKLYPFGKERSPVDRPNFEIPAIMKNLSSLAGLIRHYRRMERRICQLEQRINNLEGREIDEFSGQPNEGQSLSPGEGQSATRGVPDDAVRSGGGLRINVECGSGSSEGYTNVNSYHVDGVDMVADPFDIPFKRGQVREIRSVLWLQSLKQDQIEDTVLPHWHSLLTPGGMVCLRVLDWDSIVELIGTGDLKLQSLLDETACLRDSDRNGLHSALTRTSLKRILLRAGFRSVGFAALESRQKRLPQMEVRANT